MRARLLIAVGITIALSSRFAAAGPWNIEPILGGAIDYETDPLLHEFGGKPETHVAALVDVPIRYDADGEEFTLRPSGRYSNSQGYSSLASNYAHFEGDARWFSALNSATLQATVAQDSSLYFVGALVNGIGVRRDTEAFVADDTRSLTERSQLALDGSWTKVTFAAPATENLIDYRYLSAGPAYSYSLTELLSIKVVGSVGDYQSVSGITASKSDSAQLGVVRQLNEIWSTSVTGGYSKAVNTQKIFIDGFELGSESSNQNGAVYTISASRQGERFNMTAGASRALQPTGLAFLSRQDSVNLTASYAHSERWDYAVTTVWQHALSPEALQVQGRLNTQQYAVRYFNAQFTANWHWTPQWTLSLVAMRVIQQYGAPTITAASTGVQLNLNRHFLRTEF